MSSVFRAYPDGTINSVADCGMQEQQEWFGGSAVEAGYGCFFSGWVLVPGLSQIDNTENAEEGSADRLIRSGQIAAIHLDLYSKDYNLSLDGGESFSSVTVGGPSGLEIVYPLDPPFPGFFWTGLVGVREE